MDVNRGNIFAKISLFFLLFLLTSFFINGITSVPMEGDSRGYHIPTAVHILQGKFLNPPNLQPQYFYPSTGELLLSLQMIYWIPLNLYNVFSWLVLFILCVLLGRVFKLPLWYSIVFGVSICTLQLFVRWMDSQIIDIWLLNFFLLTLILLEKPKKSLIYFLSLGVSSGMLLGSKYMAILPTVFLFAYYLKNIIPKLSLMRGFIFSIPFTMLGVFWYIRNFFLFENPLYPLRVPFFPGGFFNFPDKVFEIILKQPIGMFNSLISETRVFSLFIVLFPIVFLWLFLKSKSNKYILSKKIFLIALFQIGFFLFFYPSENLPHIMVSSLRYGMIGIVMIIFSYFLLFWEMRRAELILYLAIGNMILLHPTPYHPKLVFIYIPIGLLLSQVNLSGFERRVAGFVSRKK